MGTTAGARRWNTLQKHHYIGHVAPPAQWPHRAAATYVADDYMGRVNHMPTKASAGGLRHPAGLVLVPDCGRCPNGFVLWPQVTEAPEDTAQSYLWSWGKCRNHRNHFFGVVILILETFFRVVRIIF